MTRKAFIVALTLASLAVGFAWATSYDMVFHTLWPKELDSCFVRISDRRYVYVTSLNGTVRLGSVNGVSVDPPHLNCTIPDKRDRFYPDTKRRFGGLLLTTNRQGPWPSIRAIAVPHWIIGIALLVYPTFSLIAFAVRRRRRRRKGLCVKCAYDLTGNESGKCPECGKSI